MSVGNGSTAGTTNTTYTYDALSRLSTLTSPVGTWTYAYVGNTGMVSSLTKPNGTKTNYSYDGMDRLTQVSNKKSDNTVLSNYAYALDTRDVRTSMDRTMGSDPTQHVNYSYDSTNQLTGETASETAPLSNVPYVNNSFAYDAMGNRSTTSNQSLNVGGNQTTNSVTTIVNRLNQLTSQTNTTSVNGVQSSTRTDSFAYDLNGNMQGQSNNQNSANTTYTYDEADRLTSVVLKDSSGVNSHKSVYGYDGFSRKVVSQEYSWDGSAWSKSDEVRRVYSGMDAVQERDAQNALKVNYTRNGNIGGILAKSLSSRIPIFERRFVCWSRFESS